MCCPGRCAEGVEDAGMQGGVEIGSYTGVSSSSPWETLLRSG